MEFKRKPLNIYVPIKKLWMPDYGLWSNIKWLLFEMVFSRQIVEILTNTSSSTDEGKIGALGSISGGNKPPVIGLVGDLSDFVPANLMGRIAEIPLSQMLLAKYVGHYDFLTPVITKVTGGEDNLSGYRLNKNEASQLTVYLGQLDFIYLIIESVAMGGVWLATNYALAVVFIGALLEFLRRIKI